MIDNFNGKTKESNLRTEPVPQARHVLIVIRGLLSVHNPSKPRDGEMEEEMKTLK